MVTMTIMVMTMVTHSGLKSLVSKMGMIILYVVWCLSDQDDDGNTLRPQKLGEQDRQDDLAVDAHYDNGDNVAHGDHDYDHDHGDHENTQASKARWAGRAGLLLCKQREDAGWNNLMVPIIMIMMMMILMMMMVY